MKRRRPFKKWSSTTLLKNAMEREHATKLYVGVIQLYNTFHKFKAQMNAAKKVHLKPPSETAESQCGVDEFTWK